MVPSGTELWQKRCSAHHHHVTPSQIVCFLMNGIIIADWMYSTSGWIHSGSLLKDHSPLGPSTSPGSHCLENTDWHGSSYTRLHWIIALLCFTISLYPHFCKSWCLLTWSLCILLIIFSDLNSFRSPWWTGGRVARAPLGDALTCSVISWILKGCLFSINMASFSSLESRV